MHVRYRYSRKTRTNVGMAFSSIWPSSRRVSSMGIEGEATKCLEQKKLTYWWEGVNPRGGLGDRELKKCTPALPECARSRVEGWVPGSKNKAVGRCTVCVGTQAAWASAANAHAWRWTARNWAHELSSRGDTRRGRGE